MPPSEGTYFRARTMAAGSSPKVTVVMGSSATSFWPQGSSQLTTAALFLWFRKKSFFLASK